MLAGLPGCLLHLSDCYIEGLTTGVRNVASSCNEDVCAVHHKRVALRYISLQAVNGAVLGNLHTTTRLSALHALIISQIDTCVMAEPHYVCDKMCASSHR